MKQLDDYNKIIAVKEKSGGNETVGDMWIETASFSKHAKVSEIIKWAEDCGGKLIITIDEHSSSKDKGLIK